jgi:hypothetical protein
MGEVIRFPDDAGTRGRLTEANSEPATVIILPVIRIDRDPDGSESAPHAGGTGRRRRRSLR